MALMTKIRALIAVMMVIFVLPSFAQRARSSYDPAASQHPSKRRDSFVDFTLKRINPSDTDYGETIAEDRNLLVADTVENRYFWSNLVAVSLLVCFFLLLVFQQRFVNRSAWQSAEIIAQYEHALGRAKAQVEDATAKHGQITEALIRIKESALRPQPTTTPDSSHAIVRQERKRPADNQPNVPEPPKNGASKPSKSNSGATPTDGATGAQIALFKADADLVSRINLLEQKLGQSKEIESQLRQQVNDLGGKLKAEQDKNRNLKGA